MRGLAHSQNLQSRAESKASQQHLVIIKCVLLSKICQHWPLDILENLEPPADCTEYYCNLAKHV